MTITNTILFTTLFAFCIAPYTGENSDMKKQLPEPTTIDGPYVLYQNDSVFVNYIEDNSGTKSVKINGMPSAMKGNANIQVNTDIPGKTFTVQLKQKLSNEKAEYKDVKKMLVVSDIEGNFAALRKLLQGNRVIDENFNWTFGKDHLVLVGDFVDRGTMVTEVLWLVYSLEEKAKAAGGYVHFILGNHEIMNMANENEYVHERYIQHAKLMNKPYMQLFGQDAEIGRWLGTKNVVEKIGNTLFTHGGISAYINMLNISLKELNEIARPFYTDTTYKYSDERLNIIFSDFGPFWYRNYYKAPRANVSQIDSTLDIYRVRTISTGHTVIANEIRSLYDGKVYNTDVHHAGGHSEAMLIENGKFWRVTPAGEKLEIKPIQ